VYIDHSVTVDLTFSLPALPFAVLSVALAALALVPALLRGDPVVRLGFTIIGLAALPWAFTTTINGCLDDPTVALPLARAGFAPLPLVGAGLMMIVLGAAGKVDDHRRVVVGTVLAATVLMVICAATTLVVSSMQMTAWGLWYPRAGLGYGVHVSVIPVCVGYSAWSTRRANWDQFAARRSRRFVLGIGLLAIIAISDVFLTYGIFGVYPMSWLPSTIAAGLSLYAILYGDVLRQRGVDRSAVVELVLAGLGLGVLVAAAALRLGPLALALLAGIIAAAIIAIGRSVDGSPPGLASNDRGAAIAADHEFEHAERPEDIALALARFIHGAELMARVRTWIVDGELQKLMPNLTTLPVPAAVSQYVVRVGHTFLAADLATARLDAIRPALEQWASAMAAEIVVPLIEREQLVGVCVGDRNQGRLLRDEERLRLDDVAQAAARALTIQRLRREIHARTELTREVELADVVRQARAAGGQRSVAGFDVAIGYQPAARVAGDLWFTAALGDDRLFVLIGDVTGRGTAAALVSAAVIGACQSAIGMAAPDVTPLTILALLHEVVLDIDGGRHRVTAAAATIDRRLDTGGTVLDIAFAGHRGGYIVRRDATGTSLVAVTGRGAALGEPAWRASDARHELVAGDVITFLSDGFTTARNREGVAWGERRLQRCMRELSSDAGVGLGDRLLSAVTAHLDHAATEDDLLLVTVAV
jgi:serine phosphatase RsbU (regulator of sigma subunit)